MHRRASEGHAPFFLHSGTRHAPAGQSDGTAAVGRCQPRLSGSLLLSDAQSRARGLAERSLRGSGGGGAAEAQALPDSIVTSLTGGQVFYGKAWKCGKIPPIPLLQILPLSGIATFF